MPPPAMPNGNADARVETSTLPSVVGINFGNTYASIAVFTKEGVAECIANEDGERQIACAVSFNGEEVYIGNQATHQLVKNAKNTIIGFRNLLGKKFSEISSSSSSASRSAPVVQHPDIPDEPAYKVQILQPAPSPIPTSHSNTPSNMTTPAASHAPTPKSEPIPAERVLTVSEVVTMFLRSLLDSAEDFLGKKVTGAAITVSSSFTAAQKHALEKAAADAGVPVLQLIDEAGAAAVTTTSDSWTTSTQLNPDRTQLVVDLGSSSLSLSLLSIRSGLAYVLASSFIPNIGGEQIDEKLIKFFATDFTKKTKGPLTVCPSTEPPDRRAEAKLRLAIEHTKRTISASPGAATCSVESLKDGLDYTGSINRMRFDMVVRSVYVAVADAVTELLQTAAVDSHDVDEIVYVGGNASLPGLDENVCLTCGFREDIETPFARGTVVGGGVGDPTTILARGCAIQAELISSIPDDEQHLELRKAYGKEAIQNNQVQATSKTVGVLFPDPSARELGGIWIPIVHKETALPARRTVRLDVELTDASKNFAFEVWQVSESIYVEKVKPPKPEMIDGEEPTGDDDDEEEEEVKHRLVVKDTCLGTVEAEALLGIKAKGKSKDAGKWTTSIEVQFVIDVEGGLRVDANEIGEGGASGHLTVSPQPS